jgi:uncharacterized UBP type Zn finger protein
MNTVTDNNQEEKMPPTDCPNCGCEWCDLEKDLDGCFTCGYPLPWDPVIYTDTSE